ncbi:thermonuclease family protein [Hyphomicrobium sp.]|uniref:thermonuclease family protein n=1 Tax=Hyphomicrobium sp. TaxID=82 RepID=UPI003F700C76
MAPRIGLIAGIGLLRLRLALALTLAFFSSPAAADIACAPETGSTHHVARVIDGDTVLLDDGREVRLIGALAPRPDLSLGATDDSGSGEDWPPATASRRALEALVADRQVTLRFSRRKADRYGRVLAQLSVAQPASVTDTARETWVQQQMIREGRAWAYALPGDATCLTALIQAEAEARLARRGLWSDDRFPVHDTADTKRLLRLTGRFAIVQGTVRTAARTKATTYINFGDNWRQDFTASLPTAVVDRAGAEAAKRIAGLGGRKIRVRGWIERRNGPMILLSTVDEIEILDGPVSGDATSGDRIGGD